MIYNNNDDDSKKKNSYTRRLQAPVRIRLFTAIVNRILVAHTNDACVARE